MCVLPFSTLSNTARRVWYMWFSFSSSFGSLVLLGVGKPPVNSCALVTIEGSSRSMRAMMSPALSTAPGRLRWYTQPDSVTVSAITIFMLWGVIGMWKLRQVEPKKVRQNRKCRSHVFGIYLNMGSTPTGIYKGLMCYEENKYSCTLS